MRREALKQRLAQPKRRRPQSMYRTTRDLCGVAESSDPGLSARRISTLSLRVRPALLRELGKVAARSDQNVSKLAEDALRQLVRSHRETAHLTSFRANVRRLRAAHAEIETEIGRRRRKAA